MTKERMETCSRCKMLPSIHHLDYPACEQQMAPINDEEWQLLGVHPEDPVTKDTLMKMAQISIMPYCLERMRAGGFFD